MKAFIDGILLLFLGDLEKAEGALLGGGEGAGLQFGALAGLLAGIVEDAATKGAR
jgi:hypothetical protein